MSHIPNIFDGRRSKVVLDPFEVLAVPSGARTTTVLSNTQIHWKETPEAHILMADLTARKKQEEDKVEVEEVKVVPISGETSKEQEENNDKPQNAKFEEVKASMENGVLTLTLPKMED